MSQAFRQVMRTLSYPTMIVTSAIPKGTKPLDFHGLTISSMTSLSINPKPLIQFNIKTPSGTSANIKKNKFFAIHFLEPKETNINLAKQFSRGIKDKMTRPFSSLIENKDYICYGSVSFSSRPNIQLPILKNTGKILICLSKDVFKVEDHEIWVGEVLEILPSQNHNEHNSNSNTISSDGGLLHCMGRFFKIGDSL